MTDWTKYPVVRTRVSPDLRDAVFAAADKSGQTVSDWMRWALLSASTEAEPVAPLLTNTETDQKETSAA